MANTGWPINYIRSPNALYYDYALAAAWQQGAGWIPDPDFALAKDPEIYEKAMRDPLIAQAIEQRITDVAGRPIQCQPRDPEDPKQMAKAKIHQQILSECGLLSMSMRQLAKFVFQAASYQYIDGERKWLALGSKNRERWWVPTRLKDIGWRRIRYATDFANQPDGTRKRVVWMELFSIDGHNFVRLKDTRKLVRCLYDDSEAGLNYGLGMMSCLAHYLWLTERVLMYGMQWLERWALGMLDVGVDAAAAGARDINNEKIRDNYAAALRRMQGGHVLVHDSRDTVEVIQPAGESWRAALEFKRELQDCLIRRILSARITTGGGAGEAGGIGGEGRAGVEERAQESLTVYDRGLLFEYLTRDLCGFIEYANAPQFAAVGLADVPAPIYTPEPHEQDDPAGAADQLQKLRGLALKLPMKEVHKKIGYSQPKEGEAVLDLGAPDPNAAAGGMDGLPNLSSMRDLPDLNALRGQPQEEREPAGAEA